MIQRVLLFLLLPIAALGQNTIGLPDVTNYYKNEYKAGLQNWDLRHDKNGIIYVANNEGLLSFDGKYWKLFPLPNKTIVRSLEIGKDNRIYVGGQDEIGYFEPGTNGKLQYHSLIGLLDTKERSFGDIWDIVCLNNDVYFHTFNKIFKISGNQSQVFNPPHLWSFMGICNDQLFAQDQKNGLFKLENGAWQPVQTISTLPPNIEITSMLSSKSDSILITTLKNGLFYLYKNQISQLNSPTNSLFEKERIYGATNISKERVALATTYGGVYITDTKGQLVQSFSKTEGLQNNNVLNIIADKQGNLWLGLDNGIDCIAFNSAIKHITPNTLDGAGYTSIIHNNYLFTGTSSGLYKVPLQSETDFSFTRGQFSLVPNTIGQTWGLADINHLLLLGHHEGLFKITDNGAIPISQSPGYWNMLPLASVFPSQTIVAGNYSGISFLNYQNESFTLTNNVTGYDESSRFIVIDKNNNIWTSHPYRGIYKILPSGNGQYVSKLYTEKNGLPSTLNNHVYKVKNEVLVATEKGVFIYNEAKDHFEPSSYYEKIFGKQSLRYLKEDTEGNIWFVHEKTMGVLDISAKEPTIIYLPELTNKILSGFEFVYPVNKNNIFIGADKGFFHINYEKYKSNAPELNAQIRSVRITDQKDSLLFGGYFSGINEKQIQDDKQILSIGPDYKTLHFEYSAALFGQQTNLEYSYRLKGFDDNWSAWSNKTEKEFTNLNPGTYVFEIKARNNLGNESLPSDYTFTILPPWYKTKWALLFYLSLMGVVVYYIYQHQKKKFLFQQIKYEEEQKKIQYLHDLEIDKASSQLVTLRNEKLQAEIDFKNSELATSAMHLVQKGELIGKIKGELNQIIKGLDNEKAVSELKRMIKLLNEDDKTDEDWEHFAQHFDKVHSDFVVSLKEKHPTITPNELKLSAYLRMNLSTKEIAQLMNISVRGVEISRYRLRKKLGISSEVNLFDYLIKII